jgi:heat shock protein HslJ
MADSHEGGLMRRVMLALGLLLLLPLAACGDDDDGGSGDAADLPGTDWTLASLGSDEVPDDVSATLSFHTDGTFSGSAGCNGIGGTWEGDGDELTLTVGPMTAMACEEPIMQVEIGFVQAMSDTRSFSMDDDTLELEDSEGDTLATLNTLVRAQLTAGTWNVTGYNNGADGVLSIAEGTTMTAIFAEGGALSGNGGCNQYTSTYTVDGATIAIQPIAATQMACDQAVMDQETAFLAALGKATTFALGERTLELRDADGALQVSFELAE